jgi:hypothetical protein
MHRGTLTSQIETKVGNRRCERLLREAELWLAAAGPVPADLAAELDEQEFEERVEPICVAPVSDGSRSLSEAAHELHAFAVWLVEIELDGWQLVHEADDGHLHVVHSDPSMRLFDAELHEA